jgi:hypothetical protein
MTGPDLFWLFLIFIALQPLIRKKVMEYGRKRLLARLLSEGTWTHDYAITFETVKALGLPVSSDIPKEILELMSLFPQPVRHTPAVEYLPIPRRTKPS